MVTWQDGKGGCTGKQSHGWVTILNELIARMLLAHMKPTLGHVPSLITQNIPTLKRNLMSLVQCSSFPTTSRKKKNDEEPSYKPNTLLCMLFTVFTYCTFSWNVHTSIVQETDGILVDAESKFYLKHVCLFHVACSLHSVRVHHNRFMKHL